MHARRAAVFAWRSALFPCMQDSRVCTGISGVCMEVNIVCMEISSDCMEVSSLQLHAGWLVHARAATTCAVQSSETASSVRFVTLLKAWLEGWLAPRKASWCAVAMLLAHLIQGLNLAMVHHPKDIKCVLPDRIVATGWGAKQHSRPRLALCCCCACRECCHSGRRPIR